jgi:hypothetical protein
MRSPAGMASAAAVDASFVRNATCMPDPPLIAPDHLSRALAPLWGHDKRIIRGYTSDKRLSYLEYRNLGYRFRCAGPARRSVPGVVPPSMSARCIHFHSIIGWTPESAATCSTACPPVRAAGRPAPAGDRRGGPVVEALTYDTLNRHNG